MQIREQHRPAPTRPPSCEPMEVQTTASVGHSRSQSGPPQEGVSLQDRTVIPRRAVTMTVDKDAGIYQADSTIFSREITVLPYSQLADIAGLLQQTAVNDANHSSNRVTSKSSPIDGLGAFAQRPYQRGEIIGFYTGNLVLRKPMPERLLTLYRRLTQKKWQDIVLPLYSIWQQNRAGVVQYQTTPDTYIAWSQVKIYNKGIELGIDGEHSGNPLRLLNHSNAPNTVLLPTVNPKMLQHIRADGQAYVQADGDLSDCLLIPVLAQRAIAQNEELTFHYQGYGCDASNHYLFDNTGKDIVSNPNTMMVQKPGEFPDFIRATAQYQSPQPRAYPAQSTVRVLRSTGKRLLFKPSAPGIVLQEFSIPLSPLRLWGESDQDFARRRDQLVNRPGHPPPMDISPPHSPDTVLDSDEQQGYERDWEGEESYVSDGEWDEDAQWSAIDQDSDTEYTASEDESDPFEHRDSEDDGPLNLDPGSESQASDLQEDDSPGPDHGSQSSSRLPQKRPPPRASRAALRRQTNKGCRNALLQNIQVAPHEQPERIWNLFSQILDTGNNLLVCYQRLCYHLNAKAIAHAIDGEAPEWTPELAYHYFVHHGYIDPHSATEAYRLMPFSVLKERVVRCRDGTAFREVETFCLEWLRKHYFRCSLLLPSLNLYRLNQGDGRPWDLPALYLLLKAHPLSQQQVAAWQTTAVEAHTLGVGLWSLVRAGNEHALHALIQHYCLTKKQSIRTVTLKLNRTFKSDKGLYHIDTPWSQVTLFQYILENDILDLNDTKVFLRLVPYQTDDLIKILPPAEKQKLVSNRRDPSASDLTCAQIKDQLLRDYITDSPEHRVPQLAKNLLHLFQAHGADVRKMIIYQRLVSLLTRYQIHLGCYPKWSKQAIYDFWRSENVLDETTGYQVMDFVLFKNKLESSENPEKHMAHYFREWIKTQQPILFVRHLAHYHITYKGHGFTTDYLFSLIDKYNLPYREQDLGHYKACKGRRHDRSLVDLPRRIRQYKDKAALRTYIEQWLIRSYHQEKQSLSYIVRNMKAASIGKNNSKETLKQFREAFQAEVWTAKGLFQFITNEGMIDFSKPENFCYLSPGEAGRFLPNGYCLDYARYAIALGKPKTFLSNWHKRCCNQSANFSPSAFYGELARYLLANPPRWPYTHAQMIKGKYHGGNQKQRQELQTLLKLEALCYQAESGYGQAPDSLLVLIYLSWKESTEIRSKYLRYLRNFQIKIPRDAEGPVTRVARSSPANTKTTNPKGQAGTLNWTMANLKKLLALYDQKFQGTPGSSEPRQ